MEEKTELLAKFYPIMYIGHDCIPYEWIEKAELYLDIACKELKLIRPILNFEYNYDNCNYNAINNSINMGLKYINSGEIFTHVEPFIKLKFNDDKFKGFLFTLFHELGHCFQEQKHSRWTLMFRPEYWRHDHEILVEMNFRNHMGKKSPEIPLFFHMKYRKLKMETNADKIAIILCKRYFPELFLTNQENML